MTLDKAIEYLKFLRSGTPKKYALNLAAQAIQNSLWSKVYVNNLFDLWEVPTAADMRALMKSGGRPPRTTYNKKYFQWKVNHGYLNVHEVTGIMKSGTRIGVVGDKVIFHIPDHVTTRTKTTKAGKSYTFNFGPIHERRKSVLKSTMVFAWQDIMSSVTQMYVNIAKNI